jgi:hypothetical protein
MCEYIYLHFSIPLHGVYRDFIFTKGKLTPIPYLLLQLNPNKRCILTLANTVAAYKENDLFFCSPQLLTKRGIKNSKAAIQEDNLHACLSVFFRKYTTPVTPPPKW